VSSYRTSRIQNVQVTKCPGYKAPVTKCPVTKRPANTMSCCYSFNGSWFIRCIQGGSMQGSHKAGSTAAIRLPIGYRLINQTYPNIKFAQTHGLYHPCTALWALLITTSLLVVTSFLIHKIWTPCKMDVWQPGRFVTWTFCNWMFGKLSFCNWTLCNLTFCDCTSFVSV
jgi:hypothetical protein